MMQFLTWPQKRNSSLHKLLKMMERIKYSLLTMNGPLYSQSLHLSVKCPSLWKCPIFEWDNDSEFSWMDNSLNNISQ
jgi:hypothetical protein